MWIGCMEVGSMNTKEAADALELYITTSDRRTLDAADFAFRHVGRGPHILCVDFDVQGSGI